MAEYQMTKMGSNITCILILETIIIGFNVTVTQRVPTTAQVLLLKFRAQIGITGQSPFFTVVMVIYHYIERTWRIIVTPDFCITYTIMRKYYPGEPVNIHIQLLLSIIQENNRVITTNNGKGKLPLFCGNGERVIPVYVSGVQCTCL